MIFDNDAENIDLDSEAEYVDDICNDVAFADEYE